MEFEITSNSNEYKMKKKYVCFLVAFGMISSFLAEFAIRVIAFIRRSPSNEGP